MSKTFVCAMATIMCVGSASAATITFDGLDQSGPFQGNGKALSSYTENDFTVSAPAGQYQQSTYDPAYAPFFYNNAILTGAYNTTTSALLTLTRMEAFTFTSFDAYAQGSTASYTVTGYMGSAQVFISSGTVGIVTKYSTYGGFDGAAVDRVTIATNAPFQLFLDNITTGTAAVISPVPEPTTWAMMVGGFALVGGAMRVRRRRVVMAV